MAHYIILKLADRLTFLFSRLMNS